MSHPRRPDLRIDASTSSAASICPKIGASTSSAGDSASAASNLLTTSWREQESDSEKTTMISDGVKDNGLEPSKGRAQVLSSDAIRASDLEAFASQIHELCKLSAQLYPFKSLLAKLYQFDKDGNQWKEWGASTVNLLNTKSLEMSNLLCDNLKP